MHPNISAPSYLIGSNGSLPPAPCFLISLDFVSLIPVYMISCVFSQDLFLICLIEFLVLLKIPLHLFPDPPAFLIPLDLFSHPFRAWFSTCSPCLPLAWFFLLPLSPAICLICSIFSHSPCFLDSLGYQCIVASILAFLVAFEFFSVHLLSWLPLLSSSPARLISCISYSNLLSFCATALPLSSLLAALGCRLPTRGLRLSGICCLWPFPSLGPSLLLTSSEISGLAPCPSSLPAPWLCWLSRLFFKTQSVLPFHCPVFLPSQRCVLGVTGGISSYTVSL